MLDGLQRWYNSTNSPSNHLLSVFKRGDSNMLTKSSIPGMSCRNSVLFGLIGGGASAASRESHFVSRVVGFGELR